MIGIAGIGHREGVGSGCKRRNNKAVGACNAQGSGRQGRGPFSESHLPLRKAAIASEARDKGEGHACDGGVCAGRKGDRRYCLQHNLIEGRGCASVIPGVSCVGGCEGMRPCGQLGDTKICLARTVHGGASQSGVAIVESHNAGRNAACTRYDRGERDATSGDRRDGAGTELHAGAGQLNSLGKRIRSAERVVLIAGVACDQRMRADRERV